MLGDFGLAKDLAGASGFTFAAGTPAYMAPEQARSSTGIDERADVFSATAVLYELLTGRPAFSAETLSGVSRSHQASGPAPLTATRPDAPPALWPIIRDGLAPAPENRIGSAQELIDALEDGMAGRGTPPPPPPPPTITARPPDGHGATPVPLPVLVDQALRLIEDLRGQQAGGGPGGAGTEALTAARRRLLGPLQVVVVGPSDGTTSELAWGLAGEHLSAHSRGGHGQVPARLEAASPAPNRRNEVIEVLAGGGSRRGRIEPDATGAFQVLPAAGLHDVVAFTVSLTSPALTHRTIIDAGPLLDPRLSGDPGAARALAEADLLAMVLPASVESGRALLATLRERLRTSPGGPVLAMGVVSPGPGSTLGSPGSLPSGVAELVAAYATDATVTSLLSVITALADGRAPMLDRAFEALLRHGDAIRVTAALALAEEALARQQDPAARSTYHALRDARDSLTGEFPVLEELAVLREEASGRLTLPASYRQELRRLLAGGDPAARLGLAPGSDGTQLRETAEASLERWRTFVNTGRAPFASIHASQTVVRALERLWTGSQQRR